MKINNFIVLIFGILSSLTTYGILDLGKIENNKILYYIFLAIFMISSVITIHNTCIREKKKVKRKKIKSNTSTENVLIVTSMSSLIFLILSLFTFFSVILSRIATFRGVIYINLSVMFLLITVLLMSMEIVERLKKMK